MADDLTRWRTTAEFDSRAGAPVGNALYDACNEVERLRARNAELESGLNWQTSCTSCARTLDASVADHERAEKAEADREEEARTAVSLRREVERLTKGRDEAGSYLLRVEAERDALKAAMHGDAVTDDLTEIKQRIAKAHEEIGEIAAQGPSRRFRMSIPAQPDRDSDLLIGRALRDGEDLAAEVERLRFEEKHLRAELAKADAENNAAGQRAGRAEAERDRLRNYFDAMADQRDALKAAIEVYQRWQHRVLKHIPRDDREALTAHLAALVRTTTDNRGHAGTTDTCQGCTTTLAACRAEGGRCCDLCQHPRTHPVTADTTGEAHG